MYLFVYRWSEENRLDPEHSAAPQWSLWTCSGFSAMFSLRIVDALVYSFVVTWRRVTAAAAPTPTQVKQEVNNNNNTRSKKPWEQQLHLETVS